MLSIDDFLLLDWKGQPQDKLIYIRWLMLVKEESHQSMSVSCLAKHLRLKESLVRSSVARLLQSGVAELSELRTYEPIYPSSVKKYNGGNNTVVIPVQKIAYIKTLLGCGSDLVDQRAESLAKRLLQAMLVVLCDDLGVIKSVSLNQLAVFTGMTVQRIRRYKDDLLKSNFILKYIPGGNAPSLYQKVKSICIIDPTKFGCGKLVIINCLTEYTLGVDPSRTITKLFCNEMIGDRLVRDIDKFRFFQRIKHIFEEMVIVRLVELMGSSRNINERVFTSLTVNEKFNDTFKYSLSGDVNGVSEFLFDVLKIIENKVNGRKIKDVFFLLRNSDILVLFDLEVDISGELQPKFENCVVFKSICGKYDFKLDCSII